MGRHAALMALVIPLSQALWGRGLLACPAGASGPALGGPLGSRMGTIMARLADLSAAQGGAWGGEEWRLSPSSSTCPYTQHRPLVDRRGMSL